MHGGAARVPRVAGFWTGLLAAELTLGVAVAARYTSAAGLPAVASVVMVVPVLLTSGLIGVSFLVGGLLTRAAGGRLTAAGWCAALVREWWYFGSAWLDMIVEPLRRPEEQERRVPGTAAAANPVLLLHGFGCNRGVWTKLRARLRSAGFAPVYAANLQPCADLQTHVTRAAQLVRTLAWQTRAPVHIVGHSMGGLVGRALLRVVEPGSVASLVTVGAPHAGTVLARWLPGPVGRQLRIGSAWLRALGAARPPIPLTCIYSLADNIVVPASSAALPGGLGVELTALGHFGLVRSARGTAAILAALLVPHALTAERPGVW